MLGKPSYVFQIHTMKHLQEKYYHPYDLDIDDEYFENLRNDKLLIRRGENRN